MRCPDIITFRCEDGILTEAERVIPPSIAKNTYHDDYSLVIVPFGDLSPAGEYTLEATIKGEAFDVRLWDNVGQDLVVGAITPDAQNKIKLNFKGPRVGVGLMVATPDTDAEVSWELSGTGGGSSGGYDGQLTTKTLSVSQTTNLISFFPSSKTFPTYTVSSGHGPRSHGHCFANATNMNHRHTSVEHRRRSSRRNNTGRSCAWRIGDGGGISVGCAVERWTIWS